MKQKLLSLVVTFVAMFAWTGVKAEDITVTLGLNSSYVKDNVYTFTDEHGVTFKLSSETLEYYEGKFGDANDALHIGNGSKGKHKSVNISWKAPLGRDIVVKGISIKTMAISGTSQTNCLIGDPNSEASGSTSDANVAVQRMTLAGIFYLVESAKGTDFSDGAKIDYYYSNSIATGNRSTYLRDIQITYTLSDAKVEADLTINSSAEYGTFVAPFDVTLPEGVTAYTIASTTGSPAEDGVANFTAIEGNVLPACTPAVVYKVGGQETVIYKGVPTTTAETVTGANGLVGVLTDGKTAPENSYVINYINDHTAFYIVKRDDIKVAKNRCYLTPQAEGAAKIAFSFGNPTAVTSVNANATVSAIYNAAGARVSATQKGMNIIKYSDGSVKKVLVK